MTWLILKNFIQTYENSTKSPAKTLIFITSDTLQLRKSMIIKYLQCKSFVSDNWWSRWTHWRKKWE